MSGIQHPQASALRGVLRTTLLTGSLLMLAACEEGQMPAFLQPTGGGAEEVSRGASSPGGLGARAKERDVEAPEIFEAREAGLWDGRPSLGGVWVAHPEVQEPERAIIRNQSNGKFVVGALFRKERQTPGPRLQVSSDAAAALGMLAGAPTNLDVVALRREEIIEEAAPDGEPGGAELAAVPAAPDVTEGALEPAVTSGTLDPVVGGAAAALAAAPSTTPQSKTESKPQSTAEGTPQSAPQSAPVQTAAVAPAKPAPMPSSGLRKPYLQIGIFSVEQNAKNTAVAMRQAGMVPTVKPGTSNGKPFWRVVVGPAQTTDERASLLKTIKDTGFTDAYAVTD